MLLVRHIKAQIQPLFYSKECKHAAMHCKLLEDTKMNCLDNTSVSTQIGKIQFHFSPLTSQETFWVVLSEKKNPYKLPCFVCRCWRCARRSNGANQICSTLIMCLQRETISLWLQCLFTPFSGKHLIVKSYIKISYT